MPLFKKRKNGTLILDRKEFASHIRKLLGVRPGNLPLYEMALIHRSATVTLPDGRRINNERLEFLGDSILNSILSDWIFENFPDATEGHMTKIRSKIVNREFINEIAVKLGINKILVSNISPSNSTRNLYGNAFEALIGAAFLDKGYQGTKKFFINRVLKKYLEIEKILNTDSDYKSLILEWAQKTKQNIQFNTTENYDNFVKKTLFTSVLLINDVEVGRGTGTSKKEAEQEAACMAWIKLNKITEKH